LGEKGTHWKVGGMRSLSGKRTFTRWKGLSGAGNTRGFFAQEGKVVRAKVGGGKGGGGVKNKSSRRKEQGFSKED